MNKSGFEPVALPAVIASPEVPDVISVLIEHDNATTEGIAKSDGT